jgi:hypothetical protein
MLTLIMDARVKPAHDKRESRDLGRACLLLHLAREALPPQLVRALAHALNGGVILRGCLRSVGFLLLARLEKALGAVLFFVLGHANLTRRAVESSDPTPISNAEATC